MTSRLRGALPVLLLIVAAACSGGPQGGSDGLFAPGTASRDGEDGLIVGHRLMASGEYELALRAYYRAATEHGVNADVLSAVGSADLKLGRLNQAEQVLRRAIEADERFVPAWNNLGVVLMERGKYSEASRVFQTAFALDSGRSDAIRENMKLAQAKMSRPPQDPVQEKPFRLVRRGAGDYLLLTDQ